MFASILFYTISVQCPVNFVLNPMFILKTFRLSRCGRKCLRKLGKHLLWKLTQFYKMTFIYCLYCYLFYAPLWSLVGARNRKMLSWYAAGEEGCKVEPNIAKLGLGGGREGRGEGGYVDRTTRCSHGHPSQDRRQEKICGLEIKPNKERLHEWFDCYIAMIAVDSAMAASQNRACSTQLMCHWQR